MSPKYGESQLSKSTFNLMFKIYWIHMALKNTTLNLFTLIRLFESKRFSGHNKSVASLSPGLMIPSNMLSQYQIWKHICKL